MQRLGDIALPASEGPFHSLKDCSQHKALVRLLLITTLPLLQGGCAAIAADQAMAQLNVNTGSGREMSQESAAEPGSNQGHTTSGPFPVACLTAATDSQASAPDCQASVKDVAGCSTARSFGHQSKQTRLHPGQTMSRSPSQGATLAQPLPPAAAQPPHAALQHYDSAPAFVQAASAPGAVTARRSTSPTMLRSQHLPGMTLHHRAAFPSTLSMRHEAGTALHQGHQPGACPGE